jgi:hypothetical protein
MAPGEKMTRGSGWAGDECGLQTKKSNKQSFVFSLQRFLQSSENEEPHRLEEQRLIKPDKGKPATGRCSAAGDS